MLVLAASSQGRRRGRPTAGGHGTTAGGTVEAEARTLVRGAVGDAAGLTIKGQIRQAARHLGYGPEHWRVREAWYGRGGSWSAAALDDLRRRHAAWREWGGPSGDVPALARRVRELRAGLARLDRELAGIEAEVAGLVPVSDRGGAADA